MSDVPIDYIRNIGIMAHIDAGKTTTSERLLYLTGVNHKIGEVHDGTATMDFLPEEQARGITIGSAAISMKWKDYSINLVDTPGHVDFTVEVERSLRVLDGVVAIFCAVGGVEPQTETVHFQAKKFSLPRIGYINKMDRQGSDYEACLREIKEKLDITPLLLHIPVGQEDNFVGIVDILESKKYIWPESNIDSFDILDVDHTSNNYVDVAEARDNILQILSDFDDSIAIKYLDESPITQEEIEESIRRLTLESKIMPIFLGSSFKNKGVQLLIEGVMKFLPSPVDVKQEPYQVFNSSKGVWSDPVSDKLSDPSALVFKISYDKFLGPIAFTRVKTGNFNVGDMLFISGTEKFERLQSAFQPLANRRKPIKSFQEGDIVCITGIKNLKTGDTISTKKKMVKYSLTEFPKPVISLSLELEKTSDEQKLTDALKIIKVEDPSFDYEVDKKTSQLLIKGMGELHLDVIAKKIKTVFDVNIKVGHPQVTYKETIENSCENNYAIDLEVNSRKIELAFNLKIEPHSNTDRKNIVSVKLSKKNEQGIISNNLLSEIIVLLDSLLLSGPLMFSETEGISLEVSDLYLSDAIDATGVIKKEIANKVYEEYRQLSIRVLEPIMKVQINTPSEYSGEVISLINQLNGSLQGIDNIQGRDIVSSLCPLEKLFGFSTKLRSSTQGRASFSMNLNGYDALTPDKQNNILRARGYII